MKKPFVSLFAFGLIAAGLTGLGIVLSSWSQAAPSSQESLSAQEKDINLRCAQRRFELARFNLQNALGTNKQVPNTYPSSAIVALREAIAISEAEVQEAGRGTVKSWRRVQIRTPRQPCKLRKPTSNMPRSWPRAVQNPAAATGASVARLSVNLAQVRLERARAMSGAPALSDLDWQCLDLRMQMLQISSSIQ